MNSEKPQNSKPPYPILCDCCNGMVCYSFEKQETKLNIPVYCHFCCGAIEALYEHYFESDRFDIESYKWKFDFDTDIGRKNHSAMWRFAVNQTDIYWAFYPHINKDLSDLSPTAKSLLEMHRNELPINKTEENT